MTALMVPEQPKFNPSSNLDSSPGNIKKSLILTFLNEKNINLIIVSGGGRKNKTLMNYLEGRAIDIDNLNFDGDFIESQAFAYLAVRSLNKLPITFPETTGVKTAVTGGVIKKV